MAPRFCANLNYMFQESSSLLSRYKLAAEAGFQFVECANPYQYSIPDLVKAKTESGLDQILINTPTNLEKKEFGFAAMGHLYTELFMNGLKKAIEYAVALDCSIIHIMSGIVEKPDKNNRSSLLYHLNIAIPLLQKNGITGVIEAINPESLPNYYISNYEDALSIVKQIDSPNIKLLLDIFHLQKVHGNLTTNIAKFLPYSAHVQLAQVPSRHEPEPAEEINYHYVLNLLEQLGYEKHIGLEYVPRSSTVEGLEMWLSKYGLQL